MSPRFSELPLESWKPETLAKRVRELEGDLRRNEATIRDLLGRPASGMRVVAVPKKSRGKIDAIGKKHVWASLTDHILVNLLTLFITIPTAMAAGELSFFFLFQGLTAACIAPMIKYLQKRSEAYG
jgi:hypothetical protein